MAEENDSGEIRTLYVIGFPSDARYREIYNFFRFVPEFESLSVNVKGRSPAAWIIFNSNQGAQNAVKQTNMLNFDPDEPNLTLRVELAKTNSHARKRTRQDVEMDKEFRKRLRNEYAYLQQAQAQPNQRFDGTPVGYGPPQQVGGYGAQAVQQGVQGVQGVQQAQPFGDVNRGPWGPGPSEAIISNIQDFASFHNHVRVPLPPGGNHPCSTLFIAGIDRSVTEQEFAEAFQGCLRMKFTPARADKGGAIAFVDFDTVDTAIAVRELMHGFRFKSDTGYGIKIEFAKSAMGTSRKFMGGGSPQNHQIVE